MNEYYMPKGTTIRKDDFLGLAKNLTTWWPLEHFSEAGKKLQFQKHKIQRELSAQVITSNTAKKVREKLIGQKMLIKETNTELIQQSI